MSERDKERSQRENVSAIVEECIPRCEAKVWQKRISSVTYFQCRFHFLFNMRFHSA